ncbi:methyltransferase, ubiE/COQ5 family [Legionella rubrilucens]|uniref:Methyltransferase, ubiE/COQ5 family n=1 Tax=Legionella rubrilucens TaxID=458 RepID=A0A0W0XVG9_9GAMM|nr:class I SAM-dependent methyltransferase [Legionella rubrilucens]KTD48728.1 methyltransferase, ubiE/COQ5 family [Legionella rubrilucens]
MLKPNREAYLNLCTQFYDLSRPSPPEKAYQFYRSYVKEAKGLILEPMCGSGRFLLPLIEEGFNVHGFDASEHMVTALNTKAQIKNLEPFVWMDFVETLSRPTQYNLIFIPAGSFGLITPIDKIELSLKTLYEHLEDKGILLFEVETSFSLPPLGIWRGSIWERPDGNSIIASHLVNLNNSICHAVGRYELVEMNSITHTEIEEFKLRLYDNPSILIEILRQVGFKKIKIMKAYDRNEKPGQKDASILFECRK